MSESANVRAIAALHDFRSATIEFEESCRQAIAGISNQLHRVGEWIEQDRPLYWKNEIKRGFERVAAARSALQTCQLKQYGDFRPTCFEEREKLRAAQRRLRMSEEKAALIKPAAARTQRECDEYRGRAGQLETALISELPELLSLLEQMAAVLEEYAAIKSPASAREPLPPATIETRKEQHGPDR